MERVNIESEFKALKLAEPLWKFLKDNPDKSKSDYDPLIDLKYLAGCPLCQFYLNLKITVSKIDDYGIYKTVCLKCCLSDVSLCRFNARFSAFETWLESKNKRKRKAAAVRIHKAIVKRLKDLQSQEAG